MLLGCLWLLLFCRSYYYYYYYTVLFKREGREFFSFFNFFFFFFFFFKGALLLMDNELREHEPTLPIHHCIGGTCTHTHSLSQPYLFIYTCREWERERQSWKLVFYSLSCLFNSQNKNGLTLDETFHQCLEPKSSSIKYEKEKKTIIVCK